MTSSESTVDVVSVVAMSDVGLSRDENEDSLTVGQWTLCGATTGPQMLMLPIGAPCVIAVADGVGGRAGGEVASALVVRRLATLGPTLTTEGDLRTALDSCNRAILDAAIGNPSFEGMQTTVAGIVVTPDDVLSFNVGDSRVYAVEAGRLRQTSVDDRPADPAERRKGVVTQTLGRRSTTNFDSHLSRWPLQENGRYLVCSDGLTDLVPDDVIEEILRDNEDVQAARELWRRAMEAGASDNVTLAVVRCTNDDQSNSVEMAGPPNG